ncbi:MAG: hypothetical protein ACLRFF_03300 [Alphaproteobacteria bacterium]
MNKLKAFFVGIFLLIAVVVMIVLAALIYRAGERSSVKSYIFQTANNANQRVGTLQSLDDISAVDLRNKLIKKYVAEYFKVIPGDTDILNRKTLWVMSGPNAFEYWKKTEAKAITEMSASKMFRVARVHDDGIATYNKPENENENSDSTNTIYYKVRYHMLTWAESNVLEIEPTYEQGTLYLEIEFEPGLRKTIDGHSYNIREYLKSGKNPAGLFKFRVINIGDNTKK